MTAPDERARRWRLLLGEQAESGGGSLSGDDVDLDRCLSALYDADGGDGEQLRDQQRRGGLGASAPRVARWLGDIRRFFPSTVVRVMQRDAMERLNLRQLLVEKEMLESVEPDVHLVTTLVALKNVIPAKSKETARIVVRKVVDELIRRLAEPTREAVRGSLNRATRNRRPRHDEIDWNRTIRANLRNWIPEHKTLVPERLHGFGRKRSALRDIVLCVDQSGSMAESVVYASLFAAVLASIPAVRTSIVLFDTAVVDMTEQLGDDPVDLLFGIQLGGGTDINRAIGYSEGLITRPEQTIFVLLSDLFEGGNESEMLQRAAALIHAGVSFVTLLALSDNGAPSYSHATAAALAGLGSPCFACTPDQFPDLMANAIMRRDMNEWAAANDIVTTRA